jgi:rhodanese-related sulfurtransferase
VAQILIDNGFSNVKALLGGFAAWQQAGFPVESSIP